MWHERITDMFYRYEARRPGDLTWKGVLQVVTPRHRRRTARFLTSPKWYSQHPDIDTRCWFTQYGYDKYHTEMEAVIEDCRTNYYPLEIRLIQAKTLKNIAMQGKVQCICLT